MIGNLRSEAVGQRYGAGRHGGKALIPTAGIGLVKCHGLGAGSEGQEWGLKEFFAANLDGGDLASEMGEEDEGEVAFLQDNVFIRESGN